ncbi:hypothetical protein ACQEVB_11735 [Pseudonocardia sp. CA-107938]|uniref:hypothetical protein n=1 Tax=Pseudonocardia sp. CA-107938 TaxID=3240021 RepID=UPI003D8AC114
MDGAQPIDHRHLATWSDEELTDAWQQLGAYESDDPYIVAARDGVAREREMRRVMSHLHRPDP